MSKWLPSFLVSVKILQQILDLLGGVARKLTLLEVTMAGKFDEVKAGIAAQTAQIGDLQTALDAEQAQITAVLESLNQTIADLTAQVGNNISDADLQEAIDALSGNAASLAAMKADIQSTIPDAPAP